MWQGLAIGTGISFLTALVTWVIFRWALARGPVMFTRVFIAGIGGRLLVVGASALLVLGLTDIHRLGFGAGLVATYLVLLAAEVAYLLRRARGLAAFPSAAHVAPSSVDATVDTPPSAP